MELKKSPFLHFVPLDEQYVALYHSLDLNVVFIDKSISEKILLNDALTINDNSSESVFNSLYDLGLLINAESDGLELLRQYQKALLEPSINILYLLLTDNCNIRCKYCYFLANMPQNYSFSSMDNKTAINAINMFVRLVKKSIKNGHLEQQIVIYGGESTINKKTLIALLQYIDSLRVAGAFPETIGITLNTNGILLDREILEQCKKSNAIVAISIDGPKDIHNQMRIYASGLGTFDDTIRSYRLAQQTGVKTGVCVTVDQHNLTQMREIVTWLVDELGVKGLGFNILIGNDKNGTVGNTNYYAKTVAQELIECFKIAREKGVYEDRMMRRVKNFIDKTPVLSDCGGCGLQIVVSPDGKVGTCQAFCGEKKFFVETSFESFEPETHEYWKLWRKRSPLNNSECLGCIALGNCGGGCPYNAYCCSGSIEAIDRRFCEHAKSATYFLINDLWSKQKNNLT